MACWGEVWRVGAGVGAGRPKHFAYSEGDSVIVKVPATPPPRLHRDLVGDFRDIYLYGLREFGVRVNVPPTAGSRRGSSPGLYATSR